MSLVSISLLGVCLLSVFVYYVFIIPLRNLRRFRGIPSPKGSPVLGNVIELWGGQYEFNKVLDRWSFKYGTRLVVWFTHWFPLVILGNVKDAKKILSSRAHVEKGLFYKVFDEPIGTGAFNCPVDIWKKRRPHLEQAFHTKVLQRLPPLFNNVGELLLKALEEDGNVCGKVFDIHPYLNFAAIQIIIEGAIGVKADAVKERNEPYWKETVHNYTTGTFACEYKMLRPWFLLSETLWKLSSYSQIITYCTKWSNNSFQNMIERRRQIVPTEDEKIHPNFLDLLLLQKTKEELKLTDIDIVNELFSVFTAGHDASAKAMSFAILYLGFYPKCQEKVYLELKENKDLPITEKELREMPYLECCIKESLRLMPPVSLITRKTGTSIELEEGSVIPSGTEVAIATYLVHRDPEVWLQPDLFKPERFFPENSKGRDPYAWIPFSAGPRNCLGPKFALMEMKTILAHLLRNYRIESVGNMDDWVLNTNVTLKLEGGWNVRLYPR